MSGAVPPTIDGIDFVIPWVDGSDPAWRAEMERFLDDQTDYEGG